VQRSHVRNQRVVDRTRIRVLKCGHPIAIHGGSFLAGADDGRSNLRRRQEGIRVRLAQRGQRHGQDCGLVRILDDGHAAGADIALGP
jgi:hypothetical protein